MSGAGAAAGAAGGAGGEAWYFSREALSASPSRRCGLDADKELAYRQQAANLIQDMGQRLQVSQLCINTAIVYMHRFYAFHSFTHFHRNAMSAASLFLAAKVEEQPRKLEYVIKVAHVCLHRGESAASLDPRSEHYLEQAQDLVFNENVLLQTLGFDVAIDHPHTHVVRTCHLVKAPKDLAQTSYFMASNSLHLTTMCLQFRPTVVACFCIHLASKWSNWAIPQSNEGRPWFSYVDRSVTMELLERLTAEFLHIFDKCPSRLKRKMMSISSSGGSPHSGLAPHAGPSAAGGAQMQVPQPPVASSPFDAKKNHMTDDMEKSFDREYEREKRRAVAPGGYVPAGTAAQPPPQKLDFREYREKREREERERRHQAQQQQPRPAPAQPPPPRPSAAPAPHPHHQRSQGHHKPHPWPHHKPPHHKPPHDSRHHRPTQPQPNAPPQAQLPAQPSSAPPQPQPELIPQQRMRPPSLFSPENATAPSAAAAAAPRRPVQQLPQQRRPHTTHPLQQVVPPATPPVAPPANPAPIERHTEPPTVQQPPQRKRTVEPTAAAAVIREMQPPAVVSPLTSPTTPSPQSHRSRPRTYSSEPELVPVVKKLDDTPGYENVIRDSQRGNAIRARGDRQPEQRRPAAASSPQRPINGIETDPTLVSNLLKESLARPQPIMVPERPVSRPQSTSRVPPPVVHEPVKAAPPEPIAVAAPASIVPVSAASTVDPNAPPGEHRHRSDKKKKKEKHKHKDRDKPRDERKKHKKDKDREKKRDEASPAESQPVSVDPGVSGAAAGTLRITIPRDKLATSPGFKIKIPKERLAAPPPTPPMQRLPQLPQQQQQWQMSPHASGLKIKIPKEVLETSRKRAAAGDSGPPPKTQRHNGAPPHAMHKVEGVGGILPPLLNGNNGHAATKP